MNVDSYVYVYSSVEQPALTAGSSFVMATGVCLALCKTYERAVPCCAGVRRAAGSRLD